MRAGWLHQIEQDPPTAEHPRYHPFYEAQTKGQDVIKAHQHPISGMEPMARAATHTHTHAHTNEHTRWNECQ
jgi:hypothetical protein